ncbi:unnamed protein product [Rhodiola kirilowii]
MMQMDRGASVEDQEELIRTYKAWKGSNVFCFGGRLIFGPDVRSLPLTILLIVAPLVVFLVFVGRKLMDDFNQWGVAIVVAPVVFTCWTLCALLLTSSRDPGIIPRNKRPPEPEGFERSETLPGQTPRLPRTKDVIINGTIVKVKYCDTCMLYRTPRSSHCSICDNCVERFDHHCPWVGQCIGVRNYRFFYMFVSSATLLCVYVFSFCWVYITMIMESEDTSIWEAMIKTPASIALIIYTFIATWFVGGLSVFHFYLISTNQSTYENFRYKYDRRVNPFNKSMLHNFADVFCTPIPPSKNNFRALVPVESGFPERQVSQDYFNSIMRKEYSDIEMGKMPDWQQENSQEGGHHGERHDGNLAEKDAASTDVSRSRSAKESRSSHVPFHPRNSSWS